MFKYFIDYEVYSDGEPRKWGNLFLTHDPRKDSGLELSGIKKQIVNNLEDGKVPPENVRIRAFNKI
jgi:hypothetical protein